MVKRKRKRKSKIKYPSWGSDVRRKKYANDPAHRDVALSSARGYYRRQHGVNQPNIRAGLKSMHHHGMTRRVLVGESVKVLKTYTLNELAAMVGRSVDVLRRWVGKKMLPGPSIMLGFPGEVRGPHVYTHAEARAILHVLADHFDRIVYYRQDHQETRAKLYDVISKLRDER